MATEIDEVTNEGKAILPSISEADQIQLTAQLNKLKHKHTRIAGVIRERSLGLRDQLKQCQAANVQLQQSVALMTEAQQELKELNKPVGCKAEDVQGMLGAYEVGTVWRSILLLKELRAVFTAVLILGLGLGSSQGSSNRIL